MKEIEDIVELLVKKNLRNIKNKGAKYPFDIIIEHHQKGSSFDHSWFLLNNMHS